MTQVTHTGPGAGTTPARWYPDPQVPGQQRYWDGVQWTDHRAPMFQGAPTPTVPLSPGPPLGPIAAGRQQNWFLRHPVVSAILVLLVIGIIASAVSGNSDDASTAKDSGDTTSESATSPDKKAAVPAPKQEAPAEEELSLQDQFLDVVESGSDTAAEADNEIRVVQARKDRTAALQDLLPPSLEVNNWTGVVEEVSTELGGDAGVLAISISDDVAVQTWNNSLSDIGSNTLIAPNSDLYALLGELSEGDEVTFSGQFVRDRDSAIEEQSLIDENGMMTPDFSFRFESITKN